MRTLLLACLAAALLLPAAAVGSGEPVLYYILDGSGSMWGRAGGRIKIEIAKEVITRLLREMPPGVQCGLMAYGHRRTGDCGDIEELIAAGAADKEAAQTAVRRILPKGMTPIADSIVQAAARARRGGSPATIVLVSDGIETCGGDPCAVARKLKEEGVDFVMHVVGFGVRGPEAEQLACIAAAGGGRYFAASSAAELLDALSAVKESVAESKPLTAPSLEPSAAPSAPPTPPPPAIVQDAAKRSQSIRVKASGPGRIVLKAPRWLAAPYAWKLLDPETGEEKGRFSSLDMQSVPAGVYRLVWDQYQHESSDVVLGELVEVRSGETVEAPVQTGIQLNLPQWVTPPKYWEIRDPADGRTVGRFSRLEPFAAPPGEYDLVWRQSEHGAIDVMLGVIRLEPDRLNLIEVSTAVNPAPADWVPGEVYFWGLLDPETGKFAARFSGALSPQLVPPGKFRLIYRQSEHGASDSDLGEAAVAPNRLNEFLLNTGIVLIGASGQAAPYLVEFARLGADGSESDPVGMRESFGPMVLQPGRYRIRMRQTQHGSSTMTIVESLDLPAGSLVEVEL